MPLGRDVADFTVFNSSPTLEKQHRVYTAPITHTLDTTHRCLIEAKSLEMLRCLDRVYADSTNLQ